MKSKILPAIPRRFLTPEVVEILRPRAFLLPIDWAERNVIVEADSPNPGPFLRQTAPYLTAPINAVRDPRYQEVCVCAATQSGKSLACNQIPLGYWLEHCALSTGYAMPNQKLARRAHQAKLRPMFDSVPALARLLPTHGAGTRGGFPTEQRLSNGATWMFFGAGSSADMSAATVVNLIVDETDKQDEEAASKREAIPVEQLIRRTDAHQLTRRLVYTCTPTGPKGFIWQKFSAGTEGRPFYRCLLCGEWFAFEWNFTAARFGWDDDASETSAMATAYYQCPRCSGKLRQADRLVMLRHPLWVHSGERIEACDPGDVLAGVPDDLRPFAEWAVFSKESASAKSAICNLQSAIGFRVVGTRKATNCTSFWWNRLSSPFTDLAHIAQKVRAARDDESLKKSVTIYDMALPYEGRFADFTALSIETILAHAAYGKYTARGRKMPFPYDPGTVLVTGGIDIQKRELYAVFDAWICDADRFLLSSYRLGWFLPYTYPHPNDPRAIFNGLEHVRNWLRGNGWFGSNGQLFHPNVVAIDTAYQDRRRQARRVAGADQQVYEFIRLRGQKMWHAVRGQDTNDGKGIVLRSPLEGQQIFLYLVDTDLAKCEIHALLRAPPAQNGFWHLPEDIKRDYARGMCAERRVVEFDDANRERARWERIDPYNHPLDCEVYSWAMARLFGVKPPRETVYPKTGDADDGQTANATQCSDGDGDSPH